MKRVPNGRYTKEFRAEAIKLVTEGGLSVPAAGRSQVSHKRTRETHGPERLQKALSAHGVNVGVCRIRRIRKATTNSKHNSRLQTIF